MPSSPHTIPGTALEAAPARSLVARPTAYIYASALLFLCLRTPFALIHGFIYDEEGTVYLRYAWDAGAWRALFAPHQGYYSLFANVCGVIAARVVPLAHSAHFLFFAEIAVQMLLVYMLVECERFTTPGQKGCAVAIALLSPPTEAIVLSTIHAQFFLPVATAVILISDAERLRRIRLFALLLAGLTGMTSCVLLPFFLLQAWLECSQARAMQAAVLTLGLGVQCMVLYFQPWMLHGPHSTFGYYAASIVSNGMLAHFFTHPSLQEACKALGSPKLAGWRGLWWLGMEGAGALCLSAMLLFSAKAGRAAWLLCGAAMLSLAIAFRRSGPIDAGLMCGSGGRYFFVFNVLGGLILLLLWGRRLTGWQALAGTLIACSLVSGALDLRIVWARPNPPVWAQEVAAWRSDPRHRLEVRSSGWPGVKLTASPQSNALPAAIYDTTSPGWEEK